MTQKALWFRMFMVPASMFVFAHATHSSPECVAYFWYLVSHLCFYFFVSRLKLVHTGTFHSFVGACGLGEAGGKFTKRVGCGGSSNEEKNTCIHCCCYVEEVGWQRKFASETRWLGIIQRHNIGSSQSSVLLTGQNCLTPAQKKAISQAGVNGPRFGWIGPLVVVHGSIGFVLAMLYPATFWVLLAELNSYVYTVWVNTYWVDLKNMVVLWR